jgi:ketosteroid isomerase-like protein
MTTSAAPAPPARTPLLQSVVDAFHRGDPDVHRKQAEQANVRRLADDMYAAFLRGDLDALLAGPAEDVDWQVVGPPSIPFAGAVRGRKAVRGLLEKSFATLEDQMPEVLDVAAQGDAVMVLARETGRFKPTGRTYEVHWVQVFTFRGGKVVKFREYADTAAMLQAVE